LRRVVSFSQSFAGNTSATYGERRMPEYVLGHHLKGEGKRLALMSELLDPMHRRYLQSLDVVKSGARTLEVGCGNGSISAWVARQVAPDGRAVAVDLDLSLVDVRLPNLELRKEDIMARPVEAGSFDLVTARAVLHHVADAERAIANLVASLRPGGAILLIEPDFLPVTVAEPPEVRAFWSGWLAWSRDQGIDYQIGRTLASRLAVLGLEKIGGTAETAIYNGTSLWADYWTQTVKELREDLMSSGKLDNALLETFLGYCADPAWWTQTIAFTAIHGYVPAGE
jgi:2-polyprenyl-3-methyl-5-hydroxy-6-metoxy-1,4-benzoquinol methylase